MKKRGGRMGNRGAVTVLVTLLLIPSVFLTGFLTDLARVKLYGNQGAMAADSYAEAVLANYDGLLKDLYGLFSVTQSEEGMAAIETIEQYMASSFKPASGLIQPDYLSAVSGVSVDGFMPYDDAEVSFSYERIADSSLANTDVLMTQIGDFMKFRVVQTLLLDDDSVMDSVTEIENMEETSEAISKKLKVDEAAEDVNEDLMEYYELLSSLDAYPGYLTYINSVLSGVVRELSAIWDSEEYQEYRRYLDTRDDEGVEYSQEDEDRFDEYEDSLKDAVEAQLDRLDRLDESDPIDFGNADDILDDLAKCSEDIAESLSNLADRCEDLENYLDQNDCGSVEQGIRDELNSLTPILTDASGYYRPEIYTDLASALAPNEEANEQLEEAYKNIVDRLEEEADKLTDKNESLAPSWPGTLDQSRWYDFRTNATYARLYETLRSWFSGGSSDAKEKAEEDQERAEEETEQAEASLAADDSVSGLRDISESIAGQLQGVDGHGVEQLGFGEMIGNGANYLVSSSLSQLGSDIVNKLLLIEYAKGMFTDRVTNVSDETAMNTSLTGIPISDDINYLYQAELEYLFGGNTSSQDNQNEVRNYILVFRSVLNFASTYSVDEINSAINLARDAAAAVNPLLGVVVAGALRTAVAAIETAADWQALKEGESVVLYKRELGDMTSADAICSFLDIPNDGGSEDGISLDYHQYLQIMLLLMRDSSTLLLRVGDLITLNTSHYMLGGGGNLTSLPFKMSDTATAVEASCYVRMDFAVMPKGFAQAVLDDGTYASVEEFEDRGYRFEIIRGY